MLNLPICPASQKFQVAFVGIKSQPVALIANPGYLLVRIADVVEVECPMFMGLVSKMLRFAGDSVNLTACRANFIYCACVNIAP